MATMSTTTADIHRARDYDEAGAAGRPLVVLLHGSVLSRTMWHPQLASLGTDLHVVAPDLPGHGARGGVPFSFERAVADVAALIVAQGGRAIVCGLSLGGYVGMHLAAARPELVAGLVLCGSTVNFTGVRARYLRAVAWLMSRGWLTPGRATLERKSRALFPPALAALADRQVADGLHAGPLAPAFAAMARTDFHALLAGYRGPVLLLNGERDSAARTGEPGFLAAAPHAEVQVVPGARHAANLDAPDAFAQALRAFVRRVATGADPSAQPR